MIAARSRLALALALSTPRAALSSLTSFEAAMDARGDGAAPVYDIPTVMLGGTVPCKRIVNGLWQTAGGWGSADLKDAVAAMVAIARAGYTSFDGADIYGPAEALMGGTRDALGGSSVTLAQLQTFTKFVPRPGPMPRAVVAAAVDRSLARTPADLDLHGAGARHACADPGPHPGTRRVHGAVHVWSCGRAARESPGRTSHLPLTCRPSRPCSAR